ncbi:hypothetical protein [Pantoea sp. DY-5]|uniref:hypothetical protein n=1 Tax=Pantoea sp. DY-5 TaxID=2871488 RepID=UPI001C954021|nr:hypothetical protein [Pantoea sp. DY-5]MBY4841293.1 hypothetical protein [Pantoea sp. DY-5]
MAAVDPIVFNPVRKLFPALTVKQVTNSCLYSLGANYSETAFLQELSPTAVRRSLELTQKNLKTPTLPHVKNVFWSQFILHQILLKYHLYDECEPCAFLCLSHLFPKLSNDEIVCCVLLSGGHSREHIMNILKKPLDSINNLIANAIVRLEAGNEFLLKVFVTSYLVIDLS